MDKLQTLMEKDEAIAEHVKVLRQNGFVVIRKEMAIEILKDKMHSFSEDNWCASWLCDLSFMLWEEITSAPEILTAEEVELFKNLSDGCGGWIHWSDTAKEPVFIPMQKWLSIFTKHKKDKEAEDGGEAD